MLIAEVAGRQNRCTQNRRGSHSQIHSAIASTTGGAERILDILGHLLSATQILQYVTLLRRAYNGKDGFYPYTGLIFDLSGNLYGTTYQGGTHSNGTVFELSPNSDGKWTERVLHSFNGNDGANPAAGLILVTGGNLYGTTQNGGTYSDGTVFELSPGTNGKWTERVLHSFSNNGKDGTNPEGGVIVDSSGNLYGTTRSGGAHGSGTVFEITP